MRPMSTSEKSTTEGIDHMWYFVRWMLGTDEVDTGFTCKASAMRFAVSKCGVMFTKEEYETLLNNELSEVLNND